MKHIYKFTVTLLLPFSVFAQTNYKPGYVVTLKGDTLRGYIDYKEWDKTPQSINFKNTPDNAKAQNFTTNGASAFGVTGFEYYRRFTLPISQDQVEIGKLASKPDSSSITATVFLRLIASGKNLALFSYVDDIKQRFFILEAGASQPEELIYHAYYNSDESTSVKYITRYRNQLEYLTQQYKVNSAQTDREILQAPYTASALIKIVQLINGVSSQELALQTLSGSRWFAGAGINYSSLKLAQGAGTPSQSGHSNTSTSVFPKITGGIDFFPNKSIQQLYIRAGLSFTVNQYNITTSNTTSVPSSTSTLNFSQYNAALAPQLIYNFYNKEQLKIFIGAGAAFNFSSYNKYQFVTKFGGSFPDNVQDNYPAFSKFWLSFPISAGLELNKKIEISVCYMPSSSLTSDDITSGNVTSFQAGVTYLFGVK